MRATLYRRSTDPRFGREPVAFVSSRNGTLCLGMPVRNLGLTLHRSGGMSVVGIPKRGGTTFCWGQRLKDRMHRLANDCSVVHLGPLVVYSGEDF